ncbi:putative NRPS-like enzyme [Xylariaceae sp. FL0804]|nr:putative NRPS-like enzyme [Xylariaceae sp. FL0804]
MTTEHARISEWRNELVPHMVDRLARERPDATYGLWPVAPASYNEGFRSVSYAQFANAINGLAHWLVQQLGPGNGKQVLTYIGPNDLRYIGIMLAGMKTGYGVFLTSPRNSPAAHRALFESLKCRTLVTSHPTPPAAQGVIEAVDPQILAAPSVDELLGTTYEPYSCTKSLDQAKSEAFWVVHTSGSTGLPKPLVWAMEAGARATELQARPPPEGLISIDQFLHGKRILVTLPPFHGAGLCQYMLNAIPFGGVPISPAAVGIATGQGVVDALKQTPADVAMLVPSIVAEIAQSPELLDYVAENLKLIVYIGGDLPRAIGDRVAARVPLQCQWGASEVGIPHQVVSSFDAADWGYVRFHPAAGVSFEEVTDGMFELVFRNDAALSDTLPVFRVRGQENLAEYRSRDLFVRHPTKPDTWRWKARADDIVVFLNGEKTNPISMEQHIVAQHPELTGALVIGMQRFQAALLIEPVATTAAYPKSTAEQAAFIEKIWPSIEEANKAAPAHARVEKSLVLITAPDRPLIRAGKGTIQRAASLAQYSDDIEKLYANAEENFDESDEAAGAQVNAADAPALEASIRNLISGMMDRPSSSIADTENLFGYGLDSLQALRLTRTLRHALHRPSLALSTVYQNPTVKLLAAALLGQKDDARDDDRDIMEPLLSTYQGLIEQIPKPKQRDDDGPQQQPGDKPYDVILTGSRGTLGTSLLRALLAHPDIGHVFCLNREKKSGSGAQPQQSTTTQQQQPDEEPTTAEGSSPPEDRVTYISADLARPSLGLDDATYEELRARAPRLVVHNAWPVNFNLGLSAFRPQLAGLVNLVSLAADSSPQQVPMRLLFISSVGAVGGGGDAPEAIMSSLDTPFANGYSRSKFLAERLCDAAGRALPGVLNVAVARVGQVAGPVRRPGLWNRAEWLPSLVASSVHHLGCLPDGLGGFSEIDWVPSDVLGDVLTELLLVRKKDAAANGDDADDDAAKDAAAPGAEVFNVRNPTTTTWDKLVPAIQGFLQERGQQQLEVVSPSAWLSRLQQSEESTDPAAAAASSTNPAIKLLEFYRDGLWGAGQNSHPMSIERAVQSSPTLRGLEPVNGDWMAKWVDEWLGSKA